MREVKDKKKKKTNLLNDSKLSGSDKIVVRHCAVFNVFGGLR